MLRFFIYYNISVHLKIINRFISIIHQLNCKTAVGNFMVISSRAIFEWYTVWPNSNQENLFGKVAVIKGIGYWEKVKNKYKKNSDHSKNDCF